MGLIVGQKGETIRKINEKTGSLVFVPKLLPDECENPSKMKNLEISADFDYQIDQAIIEIDKIVKNYCVAKQNEIEFLKLDNQRTRSSSYDANIRYDVKFQE